MSRSFTNRKGERIEVSDEHLDTAIKIKEELQRSSPSRRCSWAKHKKMMHSEGYIESDSNENYRQMIKQEQKERGVLPEAEKHADMVSDNKLEAIKQEIGEISLAKRDAQNSFRELNKLKRELSDGVLLAESIERVLAEKDFGEPSKFEPVYIDMLPCKGMIVSLSDIHYGAIVDVEGYTYNAEIAEKLIMEYADKVIAIAEDNNVESVYVMNLGDSIEHLYMRAQNTFSSDKTLSNQIAEVSDLIIKFLQKLSKYVNVAYSAISGNHDRITGNKQDNIYSDSAINVSNKIIETFTRYGKNDRVKYINAESYHHIIKVNGRSFLFVHGDRTPLSKKSVLAEQSMLYGVDFDAIIGGHVHHHTVTEVGEDKYIVTFGSIKGSDEYTLKTINTSASRSQGVILVDEFGNFEIKQVKL